MTVINLLVFYAAAWLLLAYCGFWAARLLLPKPLCAAVVVSAPLAGYGVLVIGASALNSTVATMPQTTVAVLTAATLLNLLAVARTGRPRLPGLRAPATLAALLGAGAFALGSIPLVLAGSTAFVGQQWDLELYLPIAEYLKRFPIGGALAAPDNPLIAGMNTAPFRGGSGWGFSYFQAAVDSLLGWMSYQSLRPALQFWVALSVGAVYLFARHTLRVRPAVAVMAAGAWSLNGLTAWVSASGLAGHAVSFATIPFAVTLSVAAFQAPRASVVLAAALAVAGMLLSYYTGALPLYAALVVCLGIPLALRRDGRTKRRIVALAGGVGAVGLLALVGHARFWEVLPLYASDGFSSGWGSGRYVPLAEVLGLVPDSLVAAQTRPAAMFGTAGVAALDGLALLLTGLAVAGCVAAPFTAVWRRDRYLLACLALAAMALAMRYLMDYPYGYFKLLSLGGFLFPIGLAQVAWVLWRRRPAAAGRAPVADRVTWRRAAVGVAATGFVGLWSLNLFMGMSFFANDPRAVRSAVWELAALRDHVPPGSPVRVVGNGALSPQENAMLAYFLMDNPMVGAIRTAYGSLARSPGVPGPEYLVMPLARDGAQPPGVREVLWANSLVTLYRMDPAYEFTGLPPAPTRLAASN